MYLDKILWLMAWPGMIAVSYFLCLFFIKKLDNQIKKDPTGDDLTP